MPKPFGFQNLSPIFPDHWKNRFVLCPIIDAVKALNIEIAKDDSLGKGFCIGHSYFCNRESIDNMWLENVIEYDIAPMLREYWFDNDKKFKEETDKLLSLIKWQ